MKLVADWKDAYGWLSMQLSALGLTVTGVFTAIDIVRAVTADTTLTAMIPVLATPFGCMLLFLAVMIGRVIDQKKAAT